MKGDQGPLPLAGSCGSYYDRMLHEPGAHDGREVPVRGNTWGRGVRNASKAAIKIINGGSFGKEKGGIHGTCFRVTDKGRIRAIVFDFDGTLAELHLDFSRMKREVDALAVELLPDAEMLPLRVLEWLEVLRAEVARRAPHRLAEFVRRADGMIQDMEIDAARRGARFPFTRPMLEGLQRQGVKAAVITRNCEAAVRLVFPDVDRYCTVLLARGHVPKVKPDPDHLLRALEMMECGPEGALMVGDHPLDVETGKRAGVLTAGVSSGRVSSDELSRSGADWVAADCQGLMQQLGLFGAE